MRFCVATILFAATITGCATQQPPEKTFAAKSAPLALPDNSKLPASSFRSPAEVLSGLHLWGHPAKTRIVKHGSRALIAWSQVDTDNFKVTYISRTRQVYEFVSTYDTPFQAGGNQYSSGQLINVVDAQTGKGLYTRASGALTSGSEAGVPATP